MDVSSAELGHIVNLKEDREDWRRDGTHAIGDEELDEAMEESTEEGGQIHRPPRQGGLQEGNTRTAHQRRGGAHHHHHPTALTSAPRFPSQVYIRSARSRTSRTGPSARACPR